MTRNWQALYNRVGDFNARIEENVGGIRVVQAFANEDHERGLFEKDNQRYRKTKLDAYRIMAVSTTLSYLSMRLVQMVVLVAGSYFVLSGELTAGGFVGFLLLVGVFFRPVDKINSVIETYPKGIARFPPVYRLSRYAPRHRRPAGCPRYLRAEGEYLLQESLFRLPRIKSDREEVEHRYSRR